MYRDDGQQLVEWSDGNWLDNRRLNGFVGG
jgi:hypothetical protein